MTDRVLCSVCKKPMPDRGPSAMQWCSKDCYALELKALLLEARKALAEIKRIKKMYKAEMRLWEKMD
jgi:hypothetical protein